MESFLVERTDATPFIDLNTETGVFMFQGKSLPENADMFYSPVIDWVKEYVRNPKNLTSVVFQLDYFDTSSSKKLLDCLFVLKDISSSLQLEWHYFEDDDDMKYVGEDFEEISELTFRMVEMPFVSN